MKPILILAYTAVFTVVTAAQAALLESYDMGNVGCGGIRSASTPGMIITAMETSATWAVIAGAIAAIMFVHWVVDATERGRYYWLAALLPTAGFWIGANVVAGFIGLSTTAFYSFTSYLAGALVVRIGLDLAKWIARRRTAAQTEPVKGNIMQSPAV